MNPSIPQANKNYDYNKLKLKQKETIIDLDLIVKPNTLSHLIGPGKYKLTIAVGASNSKLIRKVFDINHTGNWFDDENEMFRDGIGISEHSSS